MMHFFRKHMRAIFLITIVGFLAGAFVGFGGYLFGRKTAGDAVADINGTKIPYYVYSKLYKNVLDNLNKNESVTEEIRMQKKQEVLRELIMQEVFSQEAKKYGISVSDSELNFAIQNYSAFQKDGHFDKSRYYQTIYQGLHTTPLEFEESQRKEIISIKLRQLIATSVAISEPELQFEYSMANKGVMADYQKNRKEFFDKLKQQKTSMVLNEWFKQLSQGIKVKVYLDEIEGKQGKSSS